MPSKLLTASEVAEIFKVKPVTNLRLGEAEEIATCRPVGGSAQGVHTFPSGDHRALRGGKGAAGQRLDGVGSAVNGVSYETPLLPFKGWRLSSIPSVFLEKLFLAFWGQTFDGLDVHVEAQDAD